MNSYPGCDITKIQNQLDMSANQIVKGYEWNKLDYNELLQSYNSSGFQATNFGLGVNEINKMLEARGVPLEEKDEDCYEDDDFIRRKNNCTIFFACDTKNDTSTFKQTIKYLLQNKWIDCMVTTSGKVEDDLKCCLIDSIDDHPLSFKTWMETLLNEMLVEQKTSCWTPSKFIERLGQRINNKESFCYWAAMNKIPIFCPALTESGLLAEVLYSHSLQNPGLVIDSLEDLRKINNMAMKARSSGIISVGAGIPKHHICKANCVRDGADFAVYLNTASEFDGSDSGAEPDESIACGKIKTQATPVKIHGKPNLIFPLLLGETFAKKFQS